MVVPRPVLGAALALGLGLVLVGAFVSPVLILAGAVLAVLAAFAYAFERFAPYWWGNQRAIRAAVASLSQEEYQVLLACASLGEVPPTARVGALSVLQGKALVVLARDGDGGRPRAEVPQDVRRELGL